MLKISRESEINLVNVLIDNDIISGKDLIDIKKISTENNKSQIEHCKFSNSRRTNGPAECAKRLNPPAHLRWCDGRVEWL